MPAGLSTRFGRRVVANSRNSGRNRTARDMLALQAAVLEHLPEAVYVRSAKRELLYINPAAEQLTGYALDTALTLPCFKVFGDVEARCNENCPVDRAIGTGEPLRHLEGTVVDKTGRTVPVEVTVAPVDDERNEAAALVILRDLSKMRNLETTQVKALMAAEKANQALEESEARFRDFASLSSDWLWETDEEHRFTYMSGRTIDDPSKFIGRRREEFIDITGDRERWAQFFAILKRYDPFEDFRYPTTNRHGRAVWVEICGKPIIEASGRFIGYRGVGREVTREIKEKEKLETRAMRDYVTKLPNRRTFDETLIGWLGDYATSGRGFALAFIDLDGFKGINDCVGHDAGDQVLAVVGERLMASLRGTDHVARLGGDEFGVLLSGIIRIAAAGIIAQKLIETLSEPIQLSDGGVVRVGASVGLAICPTHGAEASALVQSADLAMYDAKMSGKGQFRIARSDPDTVADMELLT